ncbi:MAG: hypothetical protein Q7R59_01260 [bacterium]|nr:hypothetical protein [bacterium]
MASDALGHKVADTATVLFWASVTVCIFGVILFILGFLRPAGEAPGKMGIGVILFISGLLNALRHTAKKYSGVDETEPQSLWIQIHEAGQIDTKTEEGKAMLMNAVHDIQRNPLMRYWDEDPRMKQAIADLEAKWRKPDCGCRLKG